MIEVAQPDIDVVGSHIRDVHCYPAVVRRKCRIREHPYIADMAQFFAGSAIPGQDRHRSTDSLVVNDGSILCHGVRAPVGRRLETDLISDDLCFARRRSLGYVYRSSAQRSPLIHIKQVAVCVSRVRVS